MYLGLERIPWLTTDWVLAQFSGRLSVARRLYDRFVSEDKGGSRQEEYYKGSDADSGILGDDTFIDRVLRQKQVIRRTRVRLDDVMKKACHHYSIQEKDFGLSGRGRKLSEARGVAAWLILELGVCTLGELGKVTGRDITTLSSAAKRLQIRAKKDLKLAMTMEALFKAV